MARVLYQVDIDGCRAHLIGQGKTPPAGNGLSPCQGWQRRIGRLGGLRSGEPISGPPRCCAALN
jgi:hypothetical protein